MRTHELLTVPIFLGGRDSSRGLHYWATAFLVGYPTPLDPRVGSTALVTARQNVRCALEKYGNVWIRLNTRDGRARDVEITAPWQYPDDRAVDVAAVPFYPPSSGWEVLPVPTDRFVRDEIVAARGVGAGDDLVVMGLFSAQAGTERNVPIMRRGTIASMPLEAFVDKESQPGFSAYLAEVRSSVGLDGCPVFVAVDHAAGLHTDEAGSPHYYLLGLMRGHGRGPALDAADLDDGDRTRQMNAGIAMVTPATELIPLLEGEAFVDFGKNMDKVRARGTGIERLSVSEREGRPSEFDRFEHLARTLVNVPKTEIDEKRSRES